MAKITVAVIIHHRPQVMDNVQVHSIWYGREEELKQQPWLVSHPTAASMTEKLRLWELLGVHAREEFPEWFSEEDLANYRDICLLYTSPSPRDRTRSRMPSSA